MHSFLRIKTPSHCIMVNEQMLYINTTLSARIQFIQIKNTRFKMLCQQIHKNEFSVL